jgi:transcription elongation factor SPT5
VKDATESTARVELHSTCQTISVDRSHIASVGVPTKVSCIGYICIHTVKARCNEYGLERQVHLYDCIFIHGQCNNVQYGNIFWL